MLASHFVALVDWGRRHDGVSETDRAPLHLGPVARPDGGVYLLLRGWAAVESVGGRPRQILPVVRNTAALAGGGQASTEIHLMVRYRFGEIYHCCC